MPTTQATQTTSAPEIALEEIEEDFRDTLIPLYTSKLAYLKKTIGFKNISRNIYKWKVEEEEAHIAFVNSMDYAIPAAIMGKSINQRYLAEDLKIIGMYDRFIDILEVQQKWLENELNAMNNSAVIILEAEYLLKKDLLNSNINEDDIAKISSDISEYPYYTGAIRTELDDKIMAAAIADLAAAEQSIAAIQYEIDSVPNIPLPEINIAPPVIPTSVYCETTRSSGAFRTHCVETPTMKSYTCDGTITGGLSIITTNCYSNLF